MSPVERGVPWRKGTDSAGGCREVSVTPVGLQTPAQGAWWTQNGYSKCVSSVTGTLDPHQKKQGQ